MARGCWISRQVSPWLTYKSRRTRSPLDDDSHQTQLGIDHVEAVRTSGNSRDCPIGIRAFDDEVS
ncbi:MAG: hypothetical protein CBC13_05705 [Planctomycetia bacterium TMED53]|nr:MAG: hypothetical protein CBC13_05705 [Planctomycetia bacterium TMED53]